ncbi:uncharacterized protein Z518_00815 [Rhinocladiella mackenziei CBS 650.93]|uniref:Lytic polysaccharide monooxygenase n=1 Tax=Rhinocladiella mackenziei CBS 650.93 TaxID=1442369 RepID=A0A0D2IUI4_9EURO|nr:uncharacterized protein Z518_00815 [Rhinocladiella mackenziei CBS 650.93]KIX09734.1 hypothetical protein Z518_00815 [Rhinocladiella mackenziei CBS 650.93]
MVYFSKPMAAAVVAYLAFLVDAHMKMKSPVPYGQSTLDNSPLLADGSDFPCKQRSGVYDPEGAENVMAIGEPQTLSFIGSAVHGGGSCQVSLTTDLQPTKDSKWMVIKSIEGGCPASVAGNLPADPNGNGASTFQYTIPEGVAPGEYTIAWSWLNKVGNREFYMNCGPATVTAAKKKRYAPAPKVSKRETSFPDMFVANLASINDCTTPESFDYIYPNPGEDVQSAGTGPYTQLSCGAAGGNNAPQQPTASGESGASATSAAASSAAGGYTVATSASQPTGGADAGTSGPTFAGGSGYGQPQATGSPAVFAASAASSATSEPQVIPIETASSTGPVPTGISSSGTNTTGTQSGPCTDEGAWSCAADGKSFQRCASGTWSVPLGMTNGMVCTPGVSDGISMSAIGKVKRHAHGHVRRMAKPFGDALH